jgi:arginyl-tRNA synthetase
MLLDVVQDLEKSSLAIEDQGAKVVKLNEFKSKEGEPLGVIVQKKDGGFIYATTDLAGIRYRVNHDKATLIVYVVDAGQSDHFAQVFQVARLASWVPDNVRLVHVPFGVVQGEDGKKLKTRSGDNVRLRDLLDEAVTRAKLDLERRLHEEEREEPEEFKAQVARTVGIAAVKYADLSQNRMTNYIFSFDKMLSFHGNTAPYLLYAYVRVKGIERKGNIDTKAAQSKVNIQLTEPTEIELAKHLLRFDETIDTVMRDFAPNRICDYLFELSQKFNQFYEQCAVLNAPEVERVSRIALCEITARILKQGLYLLGIPVLERM